MVLWLSAVFLGVFRAKGEKVDIPQKGEAFRAKRGSFSGKKRKGEKRKGFFWQKEKGFFRAKRERVFSGKKGKLFRQTQTAPKNHTKWKVARKSSPDASL